MVHGEVRFLKVFSLGVLCPATVILESIRKLDFLVHLDGERAHLLIQHSKMCEVKERALDCASDGSLCLLLQIIYGL